VVGVGNRLRGDDGVGPYVIERLGGAAGTRLFDAETVPENYLGALLEAAPEVVVFVDAADHGGMPGSCCLAPVRELVARCPTTHAPSLLPLAEVLERSGIESWVLGIQPASRRAGAPLDPAVMTGAEHAAAALGQVLAHEVTLE